MRQAWRGSLRGWSKRRAAAISALLLATANAALAAPAVPVPLPALVAASTGATPEARLIDAYRLVGNGQTKEALLKVERLIKEVPTFQLAQLLHADLLLARHQPLTVVGAAPADLAAASPDQLAQLRAEALARLQGLRERPPANTLPRQFVELPASSRHAIAVDTSRSRLYLFQNGPQGLKLVADYYVSVGKLGTEKSSEGDQRTPLGVYFVTSRLSEKQLKDFYGIGALPLNYPNEYDRRRGKTGSGIWLHGVPRETFSRGPNTTDGCVVLSNEDLAALLQRVETRTTPVVIAPRLDWVAASTVAADRRGLRALMESWRSARAGADVDRLMGFYSTSFASGETGPEQWRRQLEKDLATQRGRQPELKDVSILSWQDKAEILVVTFGEVPRGSFSGPVKRQYWGKEGGQWKIFFEGVIG